MSICPFCELRTLTDKTNDNSNYIYTNVLDAGILE